MQAAKLRKSDLLLKKKEPSVQENGRHSLEGAIVEDFASSVMDHSMCADGQCLRESRFSIAPPNAVVNQNADSNLKGRPVVLGAGSPPAV